jgi:hypothetical protein
MQQGDSMYEEIAKQIERAARDHNKDAMFHLQLLKNARHLAGVDPLDFCRRVGARDSYKREFQRMIKVAELMEQLGIQLIGPND